MSVEVVEYSEEYKPELSIFCNKCRDLGWKNNESFEAMKLNDPDVQFWLIYVDNVLACVCGAQEMYAKDADSIIKDKDFRIFFRTATLPEYQHYYPHNRYLGKSLYIRHLTDLQTFWALRRGAKRVMLSSNTADVGSPHMKKVAAVTRLNETVRCNKRGIPPLWDELGECTLFYTKQIIFNMYLENLYWWLYKWRS